jgi:hypothetical protein|tara:strand:- start:350 stop:673 length:324 start_codon:yes stop_codon:yes gene_type:complete
MKLLLAINTTFILSFIILAMASNAEGAQKEIVEETQEDNVIRQDIKSCNVEIKKLCDFKPVEIDREHQCLNKNIDNLSAQCKSLVAADMDRRRPVSLPSSFVKKSIK